jgi:hypothetical protein
MTLNAPPSESLGARINDAERDLLARQRSVVAHGTMLRNGIHEQLTSPALLGAAVGLGFLLGNRTKDPSSRTLWLRMTASAMPWMHTLFTTVEPYAPTPAASSPEFAD